jgi:hypothetical protein
MCPLCAVRRASDRISWNIDVLPDGYAAQWADDVALIVGPPWPP